MSIIISLLLSSLLAISYTLNAQDTPSKVYSIVKEQQTYDWYVNQQTRWKKELAQRPNNPDGWLSYYTATRMARLMEPDQSQKEDWLKKMDAVVAEMKKNIGAETYEYHFIQGYHEWDHHERVSHMLKAYEIDPQRPDVYPDMMSYYELTRDKKKMQAVAQQWMASGDYSLGVLLANYNTLACTAPNAILLTYGDNDTYPAWLLQQADGFRKDVAVVNINLMQLPDYRAAIFKELNIPTLPDAQSSKEVVEHFMKHHGERPLYTGLSVPHQQWEQEEQFYNVGMALVYCSNPTRNNALLMSNYKHKMLLDHLKASIYPDKYPSVAKLFDRFHIPALMTVYEQYAWANNSNELKEIRQMLKNVTKDWEQQEAIFDKLQEIDEMVGNDVIKE